MRSLRRLPSVVAVLAPLAGGCVAAEQATVRVTPCAAGVWVPGRHGARGLWHEPHWRCPGVVEMAGF